MMNNREKLSLLLKQYRARKKLRQEDVAHHIGVDTSTISKWENPHSKGFLSPRFENLMKFSSIMGLSVEEEAELLGLGGQSKMALATIDAIRTDKGDLRRILILTSVQASHFKEVVRSELDEKSEYIYTDCKDTDAFAMKVVGDCMEPEFKEGEIVTISPNSIVNSGDFAAFEDTTTRDATLKQLKRYGDKIVLHPLNPKYEDIEVLSDLRIIGRVCGKTKRY